jgi:hypothetical protein
VIEKNIQVEIFFGKAMKRGKDRNTLNRIGKELGIKHLYDWYKIDSKSNPEFRQLLRKYGNSLQKALEINYSEYKWLSWRFPRVITGFWESESNQKTFMDWMGKQLSFKELEDWYQVRVEDFNKYGGRGLLVHYYGDSKIKALTTIYAEHDWIPWKFAQVPVKYWDDKNNRKLFFDWLGKQVGIISYFSS